MKFELVGPSYVYRSVNFDAQRSINFYPAKSEIGTSKNDFILCPTPGRSLFSILPSQPIRGFYATVARSFVVAYNILYELFSDGTYIDRGHLLTFAGNVSISDNGFQLIVVDGSATGGWIFTLADNSYAQIDVGGAGVGFLGATTVCFLDGYFICNAPNTGIYFWSALYDGSTWDGTDFANAEGSPDNLVAVVTAHRQTFLIGGNTVEVIYNTGGTGTGGAATNPFERVQGVFIQYGTNAPFSVQQTANTIFWIGSDQSGNSVVWMTQGYQPQKISTNAIEFYLSQYDASTATSYSYQEDGHWFIEWSIIGMPTSIVYDVAMAQWHERSRWNTSSGLYERDRANFHIEAFGKHLVTDYQNGKIYEQSLDYNMDDDILIRRSRTLPYFTDDLEYLYFSQLQIDMMTGVGLATDSNTANTNPQLSLRWSDDGGHTWSTEINAPIGKIGEYRTRVIYRRLGRSRFRIWEVSLSANIPAYLIAAHLEVSKGYA